MASDDPIVKVTFNLFQSEWTRLEALAKERGVTVTDAIRQAIANEAFLRQQLKQNGRKLLFELPDKRYEQITLN